MKKVKINFIVDLVACIAFMFMVSTGALIYFVLPAGSGHSSAIWGLGRHDWGQVHFWLAVIMFVTIVLHLYLHWNWIKDMMVGRNRTPSATQWWVMILVFIVLGISSAPFFSKIEKIESHNDESNGGGYGGGHGREH